MRKPLLLQALLVLGLLVFSVAAGPTQARAEGGATTVTVQLNGHVPVVDVSMMGTFTYNLTCETTDTFDGNWAFDGMINGKYASSSGTANGNWDGKSLNMTISGINSWNMPGLGRPAVPSQAKVTNAGDLALLSFRGKGPFPGAINPSLGNPCNGGPTSYVITNPAGGSETVVQLPQTGAGGESSLAAQGSQGLSLWLGLGSGAMGLILLTGAVVLYRRRRIVRE